MGVDVDEGAVVVLAVDFDHQRADALQQRRRNRLVVDEGARAPIGKLHAAQNQFVVVVDIALAQRLACRMAGGQLEHGHDLPALGALAHQRSIAAPAQRQRQRIKQDGLARTRLAGEHGQAGV